MINASGGEVVVTLEKELSGLAGIDSRLEKNLGAWASGISMGSISPCWGSTVGSLPLTEMHATVSKIFKARYYPKGVFLEAQLGNNPSFVWRNIHASQAVVKGEMKWRVGNDRKIKL